MSLCIYCADRVRAGFCKMLDSACDKITSFVSCVFVFALACFLIWFFWGDIVFSTTGYKHTEIFCGEGTTLVGNTCVKDG